MKRIDLIEKDAGKKLVGGLKALGVEGGFSVVVSWLFESGNRWKEADMVGVDHNGWLFRNGRFQDWSEMDRGG